MSQTAVLEAVRPVARAGFRAGATRDWPAVRADYEAAALAGAATPFQRFGVMESWYRALAHREDVEPLLVSLHDAETDALAMHLPLIRRRAGGVRVIAFADLDLVDYNAPVMGPAAPTTLAEAAVLWRALRSALPRADLVDFRKMPPAVGGRPNPLALLPTLPSRLNGNMLRIGEDYEAWMRGSLKRVVRKEFERSWRVFSRSAGTRFCSVTAPSERRRVLAAIEEQQPIRMQLAGKTYRLDEPVAAAFYRNLVDLDPAEGSVSLTALLAGDEVVAALLGLRNDRTLTMIRISSSASPDWTSCSPGRLVIERTIAHFHALGLREFDFSVGNYDYKRRFGVEPQPLVDLVRPLTPLGLPGAAAARGRAWLGARPELEARLRRLVRGASGPQVAA